MAEHPWLTEDDSKSAKKRKAGPRENNDDSGVCNFILQSENEADSERDSDEGELDVVDMFESLAQEDLMDEIEQIKAELAAYDDEEGARGFT